jgi:hypothetical protein
MNVPSRYGSITHDQRLIKQCNSISELKRVIEDIQTDFEENLNKRYALGLYSTAYWQMLPTVFWSQHQNILGSPAPKTWGAPMPDPWVN